MCISCSMLAISTCSIGLGMTLAVNISKSGIRTKLNNLWKKIRISLLSSFNKGGEGKRRG